MGFELREVTWQIRFAHNVLEPETSLFCCASPVWTNLWKLAQPNYYRPIHQVPRHGKITRLPVPPVEVQMIRSSSHFWWPALSSSILHLENWPKQDDHNLVRSYLKGIPTSSAGPSHKWLMHRLYTKFTQHIQFVLFYWPMCEYLVNLHCLLQRFSTKLGFAACPSCLIIVACLWIGIFCLIIRDEGVWTASRSCPITSSEQEADVVKTCRQKFRVIL